MALTQIRGNPLFSSISRYRSLTARCFKTIAMQSRRMTSSATLGVRIKIQKVKTWGLTDDTEKGGKDNVEEAIGEVAKAPHTPQLLCRHKCVGTGRIPLEWRSDCVEIAAAVKLPLASADDLKHVTSKEVSHLLLQ